MPSIVFAGPRRVTGGDAQPPMPAAVAAPDADAVPPVATVKKTAKQPSKGRKTAPERESDEAPDDSGLERVRARFAAGDPEGRGGQFVPDDPSTPEDESWTLQPVAEG